MCGCDLRYLGCICDYHLRQRLHDLGRHAAVCYEVMPRTEFERRRDEGED